MRIHMSICLALVVFGAAPVHAQKREAFLQTIEVPDVGFAFVVAAPKPGAPVLPDFTNSPDALVVHLHGGRLALVFDDAKEMIKALDLLHSPFFASDGQSSGSLQPAAFYIVPNARAVLGVVK